jgi:glycerate kinase
LSDGGDGLIDVVAFHLNRQGILISKKRPGILCAEIPGRGRIVWIESAVFLTGETQKPLLERSSAALAQALQKEIVDEPDQLILGLGGSQTAELGIGIFDGLGGVALDSSGKKLRPRIDDWLRVDSIIPPERHLLHNKSVKIWADVEVSSKSIVEFIPQKGGTPSDQAKVSQVLDSLKSVYQKESMDPFDARILAGGAAGGVLIGLDLAGIPLRVQNGLQGFLSLLVPEWKTWWDQASCIISGSGRIDATSLLGKAEYQLALRAKSEDKPCILMPGVWDGKSMRDLTQMIFPVGEKFNFEQAARACT